MAGAVADEILAVLAGPGVSRAYANNGGDIALHLAPGQSVQFLFTRGGSGVHAWELPQALDPKRLDVSRYFSLLDRAIRTLLDPCRDTLAAVPRLF